MVDDRIDEECIFKKLDRVLCNEQLQNVFLVMEIEHMIRNGSDHTPLLIV